MRPIFTIHAGEYLVADYLERNTNFRVWVPSKDNGIDLLVTNANCDRTISLQVKFSKSYGGNERVDATGWWQLNKRKIEKSPADFWVLVLTNNLTTRTFDDYRFLIIPPKVLLRRLLEIHGDNDLYQVYIWTKDMTAIETRGVNKIQATELLCNPAGARDFSEYLDNWDTIEKPLY